MAETKFEGSVTEEGLLVYAYERNIINENELRYKLGFAPKEGLEQARFISKNKKSKSVSVPFQPKSD